MEVNQHPERDLFARTGGEEPQSPSLIRQDPRSPLLASQTPNRRDESCHPRVFVFNPLAEAYIAQGKAFTPVKHQAMMAEDLANLPQFLCQSGDIVLVPKRPSVGFLRTLEAAGFLLPEFVEIRERRIKPDDSICQRELGSLRPWAWGPDSVKLLEPLFGLTREARTVSQYFNDQIARLYSKAWSADFLKKVLSRVGARSVEHWICSEQEAGLAANTLEDALAAIAAIRGRGHHRVVVKEAFGVAGQNSIRLWEPEILPAQRQWLARALSNGQQVVAEPWLERELDFSVQLEMGPRGLTLCGYTGLINDRKGQFLANWAEADYTRCLPAKVSALFRAPAGSAEDLQRLYGQIFSLLEAELQRVGFIGPISIDSFIYRTLEGECRLKPVVEINPRYTMGRLTLELINHACPGRSGLLRLVTRAQVRAEGCSDLCSYARSVCERLPLRLKDEVKIHQGAFSLNDPGQAQVCLAVFEVK